MVMSDLSPNSLQILDTISGLPLSEQIALIQTMIDHLEGEVGINKPIDRKELFSGFNQRISEIQSGKIKAISNYEMLSDLQERLEKVSEKIDDQN